MKSIGIVRNVDRLGRIVLPVELRKTLGVEIGDAMEIFTDCETVMLRKYTPGCVFCGTRDATLMQMGKRVCAECAQTLSDVAKRG